MQQEKMITIGQEKIGVCHFVYNTQPAWSPSIKSSITSCSITRPLERQRVVQQLMEHLLAQHIEIFINPRRYKVFSKSYASLHFGKDF